MPRAYCFDCKGTVIATWGGNEPRAGGIFIDGPIFDSIAFFGGGEKYYCPNCGRRVITEEQLASKKTAEWWYQIGIGITILLALAFVIIFLHEKFQNRITSKPGSIGYLDYRKGFTDIILGDPLEKFVILQRGSLGRFRIGEWPSPDFSPTRSFELTNLVYRTDANLEYQVNIGEYLILTDLRLIFNREKKLVELAGTLHLKNSYPTAKTAINNNRLRREEMNRLEKIVSANREKAESMENKIRGLTYAKERCSEYYIRWKKNQSPGNYSDYIETRDEVVKLQKQVDEKNEFEPQIATLKREAGIAWDKHESLAAILDADERCDYDAEGIKKYFSSFFGEPTVSSIHNPVWTGKYTELAVNYNERELNLKDTRALQMIEQSEQVKAEQLKAVEQRARQIEIENTRKHTF